MPRFRPRRELGTTGFKAGLLGIGDLADRSVPIDQCVATLRRALDTGLNVVDTAPAYENGYSEEIVGRALAGRRDQVFLIDKIDFVNRPVRPQIEASLKRLGQETIDLVVFHGISTMDDWEQVCHKRLAELEKCIRAGLVRFKGISSHDPDVLLAAIESASLDAIMFPLGPCCDERYADEVLPKAGAARLGTICFKTFGAGKLLGDTTGYGRPLADSPRAKDNAPPAGPLMPTLPHLSVFECLSYTLTLDPDVTLLGLSLPAEQDIAFVAADEFSPLPPQRMADIRRRAQKAIRSKGPLWWNPTPVAATPS
jgi:aryl-alcohol dehydrogenase-like predicted oxidoreductase